MDSESSIKKQLMIEYSIVGQETHTSIRFHLQSNSFYKVYTKKKKEKNLEVDIKKCWLGLLSQILELKVSKTSFFPFVLFFIVRHAE